MRKIVLMTIGWSKNAWKWEIGNRNVRNELRPFLKYEKVTDDERSEKITLSVSNEAECANKFPNNKHRRGTNIFSTEDPK